MRVDKKIKALLLVFCIIIASFAFPENVTSAQSIGVDNYILAAENEQLRLYANEKSLAVVLEDKATGKRLYSVQNDENSTANASWKGFMESGFAVEFFNDRSPMPERVDSVNGNPEIAFTKVTDGFNAVVSYSKTGISFEIQARLTNDGFTAFVPEKSFKESETVRICGLYLYPFFGSTKLGEKGGYILVPEGSGAIIGMQNNNGKYKSPYTKRIYGENLGTRRQTTNLFGKYPPKEPIKIISPFYGMVHETDQTAFFSIIEQGQYNAELMVYPNGVVTNYDWVTARFIIREQYNMQTTRTKGILTSEKTPYFRDIKVNFHMLTDDSANYMSMAELYRKTLFENKIISQKDTNYKTRLDFLGADAKKWLLFDRVVPATTIEQMDDILDDLADTGLTDVLAGYKGWQSGGITKNYGSGNFSVEGKLGSKKELEKVAKKIAERGSILLLHQDFLQANPNRLYNTSTDIVKGINQVIVEIYTFTSPFYIMNYLTPNRVLDLANTYNKQLGKYENIGIAVDSLTNTLFSYYSQNNIHSREEAALGYANAISALSMEKMALEQPFDYFWHDMDYFLDMPLYTSNYSFISAEIPFIPIALKGVVPYFAEYANFEPNEHEFLLKMVEYGAFPSFIITHESPSVLRDTNSSYIYSSEYSVYKDQIVSFTNELQTLYEKTKDSRITGHEQLQNGVVRVSYANGAVIYVNYTETEWNKDGVKIPAKSYIIKQE